MSIPVSIGTAPADPKLWEETSRRSVAAEWTTEYRDIDYECWRCETAVVFTAPEQKHAFEVKKAPIQQRRTLCDRCYRQSLEIACNLDAHAERWATDKSQLKTDTEFLEAWLKLLELQEEFVAYRPDVAKKNMLRRLLSEV